MANTHTNDYFMLLKNLDTHAKLVLISKLSESMMNNSNEKVFYDCYGKLDTKESADDLIQNIQNSRQFYRDNITL